MKQTHRQHICIHCTEETAFLIFPYHFRRQKELEERLIEEEVAKRVEALVAKRVEEELERRKDEIEAEVLRRVEEAKKIMEKQMLEEMERQRQAEVEAQKAKEVKNNDDLWEAIMACLPYYYISLVRFIICE